MKFGRQMQTDMYAELRLLDMHSEDAQTGSVHALKTTNINEKT